MRHSHRTEHADDRDFKRAVEEALQLVKEGDEPSGPWQRSPTESPTEEGVSRASPLVEEPPKLSLVHGEDDRGDHGRYLPVPACGDESSVEDLILCGHEAAESATEEPKEESVFSSADGSGVDSTDGPAALVEGDQSATEDLILCEPPAAQVEMLRLDFTSKDRRTETPSDAAERLSVKSSAGPTAELPSRGDIAELRDRRPGRAPDRIGRGKLVSSRLTWKPGDPFGDGRTRSGNRFSWETMLTSACITAACGLLCVWLLHSILA